MPTNNRRGKLHRINAQDAATMRDMLIVYALTEVQEQTQHQFISKHLPDLYILKNLDGWTFKEISNLLRMRGIKLSESSLRVYYCQLLTGRESECMEKMMEMEPVIAAIKNETRGLDVSLIAAKVTEILNRNRIPD